MERTDWSVAPYGSKMLTKKIDERCIEIFKMKGQMKGLMKIKFKWMQRKRNEWRKLEQKHIYIDSNQMDVDLFWTFFKRKWKLP